MFLKMGLTKEKPPVKCEQIVFVILAEKCFLGLEFLRAAQRHGHTEGGMVGGWGHLGPLLFLCMAHLKTQHLRHDFRVDISKTLHFAYTSHGKSLTITLLTYTLTRFKHIFLFYQVCLAKTTKKGQFCRACSGIMQSHPPAVLKYPEGLLRGIFRRN